METVPSELDTPPPLLPEMVLFLMLRVPPLFDNTAVKKILRSESRSEASDPRLTPAKSFTAYEAESGRVRLREQLWRRYLQW